MLFTTHMTKKKNTSTRLITWPSYSEHQGANMNAQESTVPFRCVMDFVSKISQLVWWLHSWLSNPLKALWNRSKRCLNKSVNKQQSWACSFITRLAVVPIESILDKWQRRVRLQVIPLSLSRRAWCEKKKPREKNGRVFSLAFFSRHAREGLLAVKRRVELCCF